MAGHAQLKFAMTDLLEDTNSLDGAQLRLRRMVCFIGSDGCLLDYFASHGNVWLNIVTIL